MNFEQVFAWRFEHLVVPTLFVFGKIIWVDSRTDWKTWKNTLLSTLWTRSLYGLAPDLVEKTWKSHFLNTFWARSLYRLASEFVEKRLKRHFWVQFGHDPYMSSLQNSLKNMEKRTSEHDLDTILIWFGAPAPPTTLGKSESQRGAPRVSSLNQLISRIKYYSHQTGFIDWAPIAVRIVRNQCFSNKMNWLSIDCRKNRAKSVFFEENVLIEHRLP